jgi:hypothetical protein
MASPLEQVSAALLPAAEGLAVLAELRTRAGVTVAEHAGRVWLTWPAGDDEIPGRLLPLPGVEFFSRRGEHWHALGRSLPTFGLPGPGAGRPLHRVLVPAAFAVHPPDGAPALAPARLGLAPCREPRPTTALTAAAAELQAWADTALTDEIECVRAAVCGERFLLLGDRLPAVSGGQRWWGHRILCPLGRRPTPDLPEPALAEAVGLAPGERLLLSGDGGEVVASDVLRPLTRAMLRAAVP